ncbi:MAG: YdeI/OmpD-associated family protein [Xanthomonadales bacterium]|nr:YdeI/OmpD-associated family protein [Xanthomonadales bacterium]
MTAETEKGLKTSQKAWTNFNQMAPGYRKQYVAWLQSAKRPETRKKRLIEAIGLLEANKKPGMK